MMLPTNILTRSTQPTPALHSNISPLDSRTPTRPPYSGWISNFRSPKRPKSTLICLHGAVSPKDICWRTKRDLGRLITLRPDFARLYQANIHTQTIATYRCYVINRWLILMWQEIDSAQEQNSTNSHFPKGTRQHPQQSDAKYLSRKVGRWLVHTMTGILHETWDLLSTSPSFRASATSCQLAREMGQVYWYGIDTIRYPAQSTSRFDTTLFP